jgi:hypothetical protein
VVLRRRAGALTVALALSLVLLGCQPTPPPPPSPNFARASVAAGLGAWWDVWDWSPTFVRSRNPSASPPLRLADVDRLANDGVQTLYIQPSTFRHPAVILDASLLRQIVNRAHARGMKVVGWYLPEFLSLEFDLERLAAIAKFGFDGLGVDIESTANANVADRTQKLLIESRFMRGAYPNLPMLAIPVTPVIWEQLNRSWWPNFPYRQLVPYYDAWMPMAYWSYRSTTFTEWNDPYRYTYESVVRLRALTGQPRLPVHPIGGEATNLSGSDVFWMNAAMVDSGAIGGSVYDDNITPASLYGPLRLMRRDPILK